jgi:hypothetical protein
MAPSCRCAVAQSGAVPYPYCSADRFECADVIGCVHHLYPTFILCICSIKGQTWHQQLALGTTVRPLQTPVGHQVTIRPLA